jgi:paraquat-inducible protein B
MSKRANPTMIGAFVLGAVVLVALALMAFGGGRFFSDKQRFVTYFQGSVQGLRVGSNVSFRGVRVGEVVGIRVLIDDSELEVDIPVVIELEADALRNMEGALIRQSTDQKLLKRLIERGLRAQLQVESFVTGLLLVDLDFYPDNEPKFHGKTDDLPEIPTVPSEIQAALERAQMFVARLQALPLDEIVNHVNGITKGVEELVNSPRIDNILAGVERIVGDPKAGELISQVTRTLEQVTATAAELQRLGERAGGETGEVGDAAEKALAEVQELSDSLQGLLGDLRNYTGAESTLRFELAALARESKDSLRSIRLLTDYLERHPEALLRGRVGDGERE